MTNMISLIPMFSLAPSASSAAMPVLVALGAAGLGAVLLRRQTQRPSEDWHARIGRGQGDVLDVRDSTDPTHQALAGTKYAPRNLMTPAEQQVFRLVDTMLHQARAGYRIVAKCTLDGLISPARGSSQDRAKAQKALAGMRVDFAVIDAQAKPVLVINLQQAGITLDRGKAARMALRNAVLGRAGVPVLDLRRGWTAELLQLQVHESLMRHQTSVSPPLTAQSA